MITIADWIITVVVFVCLMILQHEIYKQDLEEVRRCATLDGYYKGLYQNVIKISSDGSEQ